MTAWLLFWEWSGDQNEPIDKVVGVLNPRYSDETVMKYLQYLYSTWTANFSELASYAKLGTHIPYKPTNVSDCRMTCGHNPYLVAEKVTKLRVELDEDTRIETITWLSAPRYGGENKERKLVRPPEPCKYIRRTTGPVSSIMLRSRF